ncbi:hypothetical protein NDU88_003444 [Pleurodeles waltl]|uniref:Uncharacterized protein n=1 Tax=Pleurodeles waltl TaxID=8319 RepID=A0AAV7MQK3_PLEWA|nr:hypothetical protein NDU88_003444 [Pleurodeles waltl]
MGATLGSRSLNRWGGDSRSAHKSRAVRQAQKQLSARTQAVRQLPRVPRLAPATARRYLCPTLPSVTAAAKHLHAQPLRLRVRQPHPHWLQEWSRAALVPFHRDEMDPRNTQNTWETETGATTRETADTNAECSEDVVKKPSGQHR